MAAKQPATRPHAAQMMDSQSGPPTRASAILEGTWKRAYPMKNRPLPRPYVAALGGGGVAEGGAARRRHEGGPGGGASAGAVVGGTLHGAGHEPCCTRRLGTCGEAQVLVH